MKILRKSTAVAFPSPENINCIVNLNKNTCTCNNFQSERWCSHLESVGKYRPQKVKLSNHPNFSQSLSGLVKSIRIREIDEAAYWLRYCWGFNNKLNGAQFRTVRRLLIGAAEDGHSISVMESLSNNFGALLAKDIEFEKVLIELIRICKVPNWWLPETGGHDYIYQGMLGHRKTFYDLQPYSLQHCLNQLKDAIKHKDKANALYWVMRAHECGNKAGGIIAILLLEIAVSNDCHPAIRLMKHIYLRHEHALIHDSNFTCQAVWFLAGGNSPVADCIYEASPDEVKNTLDKLNAAPIHVIPEWCCDGVHCAGNDIRYAGMWDRMYAVCNQFNYYGRLIPDDKWLEDKFYSLDGLDVIYESEK
jgi:hypothetical protein